MPVFIHLVFLLLGLLGVQRTQGLELAPAPSVDDTPGEAGAGDGDSTSYQEQIALAESAAGYDRQEIHGRRCADGHTRGFSAALMSGTGLCMVEGWASDDPTDCRVRVRLLEGPHQSGLCVVTVYETAM